MNTSPDPGTPGSFAVTLVRDYCFAHDAPFIPEDPWWVKKWPAGLICFS